MNIKEGKDSSRYLVPDLQHSNSPHRQGLISQPVASLTQRGSFFFFSMNFSSQLRSQSSCHQIVVLNAASRSNTILLGVSSRCNIKSLGVNFHACDTMSPGCDFWIEHVSLGGTYTWVRLQMGYGGGTCVLGCDF